MKCHVLSSIEKMCRHISCQIFLDSCLSAPPYAFTSLMDVCTPAIEDLIIKVDKNKRGEMIACRFNSDGTEENIFCLIGTKWLESVNGSLRIHFILACLLNKSNVWTIKWEHVWKWREINWIVTVIGLKFILITDLKC